MLVKVPTVKSNYTKLELSKSLISAWKKLTGTTPGKSAIGVIVSQHGIETGGGSFSWNNNLGNVKAYDVSGQTIEYMSLNGVWEIINGKRIELSVNDPGSRFLSFKTLEDGAVFHLNLLKNKRYKSSWKFIEQGDVAGFATSLKNNGYYTSPLSDYIAGMNRFFKPYMKSDTYEKALSELTLIDSEQKPELFDHKPLVLIEEIQPTSIRRGIEEAEQVPQNQIELHGSSVFERLLSFLGTILKWLKLK